MLRLADSQLKGLSTSRNAVGQGERLAAAATGSIVRQIDNQDQQDHMSCSCESPEHPDLDHGAGKLQQGFQKRVDHHEEKAACLLIQHSQRAEQTWSDLTAMADRRLPKDAWPTAVLWSLSAMQEQQGQGVPSEATSCHGVELTSSSDHLSLQAPPSAANRRLARGKVRRKEHDDASNLERQDSLPTARTSRRQRQASPNSSQSATSGKTALNAGQLGDKVAPSILGKSAAEAWHGIMDDQRQRFAGLLKAYLLSWSFSSIQRHVSVASIGSSIHTSQAWKFLDAATDWQERLCAELLFIPA